MVTFSVLGAALLPAGAAPGAQAASNATPAVVPVSRKKQHLNEHFYTKWRQNNVDLVPHENATTFEEREKVQLFRLGR